MPLIGLVHVLVALYFAVHAIRTGREMYWLFLLFMFPFLGSVVYFFAVFLPQSRLQHSLGKASAMVREKLDPGRALREAQTAFDLTPTAHNQIVLAAAFLDAGMAAKAVEQYDACLRGPFAGDPDIRFAAAEARLANKQAQDSATALAELRKSHPNFKPEQVGLLLARSYAEAGMHAEAGMEFAAVVERFASLEARSEYALWALSRRDSAVADAQLKELNHSRRHMSKQALAQHAEMYRRLDAAVAQQGS
jgi:hypothetical protein